MFEIIGRFTLRHLGHLGSLRWFFLVHLSALCVLVLNSIPRSKVIRVRSFTFGKVLFGGDARELFEFVVHVRLVVVAAAVG